MTPLVAGGAAAIIAAVVILVSGRRRRDRALEPVRLGPSWSPEIPEDLDETVPAADQQERARAVEQRTGLDRRTVEVVLNAWHEYLAVIGLATLPVTHPYEVYDPYDPPVPERGPDGPIADPVRVARDVSYRTGISEVDAATVLEALFEDDPAE